MSCCGSREKEEKISATHKWDYINLSDFKSTSCFAPLSYGILYITLIISVAVYIVDIYVAINLLLYNSWAGQISPWLPLDKSRWIFSGCIILSLVLLVYRWINAIKAIRSGGVAQSYLDPLAVRLQSIRGGGWRRFLVFAELTKSKKGAEYVALFVYFSFEAWIRIVFAEGPRKVINAMTLYDILRADFIPGGANSQSSDQSTAEQFFVNVQKYAAANNTRAAVVFSMLFTLVVWVFAALSLLVSCILYLLFLWHHIPKQDGMLCMGLRRYCKRKTDSRLQKIVDVKVNKALAKEDAKLGLKPSKHTDIKRQATLPVLADEDHHSQPASISRQPTLPVLGGQDAQSERQRPDLSRVATNPSINSARSYNSNAPLIHSAEEMGSVGPPRSYLPAPTNYSSAPSRQNSGPATGSSRFPSRPGTAPPRPEGPYMPGPPPAGNHPSSDRFGGGMGPSRSNSGFTQHSNNSALPPPYPPAQDIEMRPQTPRINKPTTPNGYVAYNPNISNNSGPTPFAQRNYTDPQRSWTASPSRDFTTTPAQHPQRSATGPPPNSYQAYGPPQDHNYR